MTFGGRGILERAIIPYSFDIPDSSRPRWLLEQSPSRRREPEIEQSPRPQRLVVDPFTLGPLPELPLRRDLYPTHVLKVIKADRPRLVAHRVHDRLDQPRLRLDV